MRPIPVEEFWKNSLLIYLMRVGKPRRQLKLLDREGRGLSKDLVVPFIKRHNMSRGQWRFKKQGGWRVCLGKEKACTRERSKWNYWSLH